MSLKDWEKKVLSAPGAEERVGEIEGELRLAAGLTALREKAGISQREMAARLGVSQPRVAAIERSKNVTFLVLQQYVGALGMRVEISAVSDESRTTLVGEQGPATSKQLRRHRAKV
ncbi:MAG: XRE family transcriptional regulator [Actinomycetota bacterium]|jgi:transcriptional regulator with XRE-family HTH domain|nr:XRE family transcriptional regulator [Actinomycetota bacterium]